MIKKILIITILLLALTACKPKKEEFYNLTFEETTVAIGYDTKDVINNLHVNSFNTHFDSKDNEILDEIEIYIRDLSNNTVLIDDYNITSITGTCNALGGEIVSNNGNACVLHKTVDYKINTVILYGDILSDNSNKVDRIVVSYK